LEEFCPTLSPPLDAEIGGSVLAALRLRSKAMTDSGSRWQKWVLCLLLGLAVMVVFWPALRYGFIHYDDQDYVTDNKDVQHGLNWQSIKWALTTAHAANWHPLTWVSHIIDCQLYGLNPAGHHLTSLLLHLANSILLFLLLGRLTGALWPSAFVAAMFALHPLRVESVVWISERKDVLSTFFWMLTVGAYVRYEEEFNVQSSKFKFFYALALVFFILGLMAKPMLVTLPFVLLLLDYWPLGRLEFGPKFRWRPVVEKIPFLLLAAGDSAATFLVQHHFGVVETLRTFPLSVRVANIPFAYVRYIGKNFWPAGLAVYYPFRTLGMLEVGGAVCVLGAVSILVVRRWRAQPYLAVGWFWFLGMLVPTIGLVQVGTQAMADRYSYLPSVGLWIMVAWSVRDWIGDRPFPRAMATLAGAAAVIACLVLTSTQVPYWRDTRALFMRAAAVTDQYYLAYYNIGCYAMDEGQYPDAILCFKKALSSEPDNTRWADHSPAYNNLGYAYLQEGEITNAVPNFEKALAIRPHYPEAYYNLGCAFLNNKQPGEAVDCFQRALAMDSSVAAIHYKFANALMQLGRYAEAIAEYAQTLKIRPNMDEAANNLAWLLATCSDRSLRNGAQAVTLARQASEHSHHQNPIILGTLAAAYAEVGKLSEAVATAQQARQLALDQNNRALAGVLESQLRRYQSSNGGSHP
jgi:tetratricopeptide (TPR) repeat protein